MEKKESSVFGIPFALIVFVVTLAVLIDGFMLFWVKNPLQAQLNRVESEVAVLTTKAVTPTPMVTPTATPSATVVPAKSFFVPTRKVVVPTR